MRIACSVIPLREVVAVAISSLHFPLHGFWGLRIENSLMKKTFSSPRQSLSWSWTGLQGVGESHVFSQPL